MPTKPETPKIFVNEESSNKALGNTAPPQTAAAGGPPQPRQPKPSKVDAHYPVARMTYLTISTEDLATLAFSSGIGSLALSVSVYLFNAEVSEVRSIAMSFAIAIAMAAYVFFGALVVRVRRRSNLTWWNLFGE